MRADLIEHCDHSLSITGAEGPIANLGRWPILWTCDGCGVLLADHEDGRR